MLASVCVWLWVGGWVCARAGACVVCAVQCDGLAPAAAARWRRGSPAQAAACSNESTTSPRLPLASESSFGSLSPARMAPHPARTVTITVRSRSADIRIKCSAVSASAAVTCGGPRVSMSKKFVEDNVEEIRVACDPMVEPA